MKISKVGIDLIKEFEGCQLKAYKCVAGVWTIGIGHTGNVDGKAICSGMTITMEKAEQLLSNSLESRYEPAVRKFKGLNQNQYDALVSFCYNLGPGIFKGTLLDAINKKDWQDVARQMKLYNKARVNGVLTEVKGLTRRRNAEANLFLKPVKDVAYEKAIQNLVLEGIIGSPAAWNKINLNNVPALISKIGVRLFDVSEYDLAVTKMVEAKIISSPAIWKDKKYTEQNVRDLIVKVSNYLG